MEIQSNLRRKKLHKTNQGSNFFGGSFSKRDNVRAQIQFRRESQPQHEIGVTCFHFLRGGNRCLSLHGGDEFGLKGALMQI